MELLSLIRCEATRLWWLVPATLVAIVVVALPLARVSATEDSSLEYAVKATYLPKFARYVDWPIAAFASPTSALTLCAVGDDPVVATLDAMLSGQRVDGRELVVRRLKSVGRDSGCRILYTPYASQ